MKKNLKWLMIVFTLTFALSTTFSYLSVTVVEQLFLPLAICLLLFIIFVGVFLDLIAIAATTANLSSLHAKASDKKKGAKTAIKLVNNADKVASICSDVVGDICGILSGTVGVLVAMKISDIYNLKLAIVSLLVGGTIAALTVTGKAVGKQYGIKNANEIVYNVGKILEFHKK